MKLLYVLILFFAGFISTSMASKGPRGHRGQEKRTSSCTPIRIFNQQLKVCLRDARTQNRILEDKNNESMETIKELEIKNQNLEEEAKQCDEENRNCMINNDIFKEEIKSLKEQIESDPCLSVSCGEYGTCYSSGASYICKCLAGWSGPSCDVSSLDCNFDANMCTWTQGLADPEGFGWYMQSGPTQSSATGPNEDHTTGNGYYMYIESSNPRQFGDRAHLVSTMLAPGETLCMELALNMFGDEMGQINVYIRPEGTEGMADVLIQEFQQITNSQTWYVENVTIPQQTSNFQIVIEGVIGMPGSDGNSWEGDAAIDDILVYQGPCLL